MIAPTTLAVAAILNAVKRYGSADGTRSFQKIVQLRAAYDCMSSTAQGSAERSPRTRVDGDGEEGQVRGDHGDAHPVRRGVATERDASRDRGR